MVPAQQSWPQVLSYKIYKQLLLLYPKPYRQEYGSDMARTFTDCCYFAYREDGVPGLLKLWAPTFLDLTTTAFDKHAEDGILSSQPSVIRLVLMAAMLGSAPIYVTGWGAEDGRILLATLLFVGGALGLLISAPGLRRIVRGRETMSNIVVQPSMLRRWPRPRSILWASIVLLGLAFFDLVDVALDIDAKQDYVQDTIQQYGAALTLVLHSAPRIVVYLIGLWLYRKQSAWAVLLALIMAAPRIIFSGEYVVNWLTSETIRNGTESIPVNVAAMLFAAGVVATGAWVIVELRKASTTPEIESPLEKRRGKST